MNPSTEKPAYTDTNTLFHRYAALGMVRGAKVMVFIAESNKYGMRAMLGLEYKTFDQAPASDEVRHAVAADYLFHGIERNTVSYFASKATDAHPGTNPIARTRARLKLFELLCASTHDVMILKDHRVIQALSEHATQMQARPSTLLLEILAATELYRGSFDINTLAGPVSKHTVDRLVASRTALIGEPITDHQIQALFKCGPRAEWSGRGFAA